MTDEENKFNRNSSNRKTVRVRRGQKHPVTTDKDGYELTHQGAQQAGEDLYVTASYEATLTPEQVTKNLGDKIKPQTPTTTEQQPADTEQPKPLPKVYRDKATGKWVTESGDDAFKETGAAHNMEGSLFVAPELDTDVDGVNAGPQEKDTFPLSPPPSPSPESQYTDVSSSQTLYINIPERSESEHTQSPSSQHFPPTPPASPLPPRHAGQESDHKPQAQDKLKESGAAQDLGTHDTRGAGSPEQDTPGHGR